MPAWNEHNTEGFSPADLSILSNAQKRLARDFAGVEVSNLNDLLNNEWFNGVTENELVDAVAKRLRC